MKLFTEYKSEHRGNLPYLNESENQKIDEALALFECECEGKLENMDEGFLGKLLGGVGGFLIGPAIGKIVAHALGVERGVLYDMFTSRLVSTALGAAIGKYVTENKPAEK